MITLLLSFLLVILSDQALANVTGQSLASSTATPSNSCTTDTLKASVFTASIPREGPGVWTTSETGHISTGIHERRDASHPRQGQVQAHHCRRASAGWNKRQSAVGSGRMVLVVNTHRRTLPSNHHNKRRRKRSGDYGQMLTRWRLGYIAGFVREHTPRRPYP
jgi:hypothetical protein